MISNKKSIFIVEEIALLDGEKITIKDIRICDGCANAIYYVDEDEMLGMGRECDFEKIESEDNNG